jgi:hypothetical protein
MSHYDFYQYGESPSNNGGEKQGHPEGLRIPKPDRRPVRSKGNRARAKRDYRVVCVDLERATGMLGEKEHDQSLKFKVQSSKLKIRKK